MVDELTSKEEKILYALSTSLARAAYSARLGRSYGNDRDLYDALGYKATLTFTDFYGMYKRQDIAKRIVTAPVQASWMRKPIISEDEGDQTKFEDAWEKLIKDISVYHYLARVDKVSGIGGYGVLYIGFNDGKKPDMPVNGKNNELIYLRPYKQDNADIESYVTDITDPRYGMPEYYKIQSTYDPNKTTKSTKVHWSRILHVAEGLDESDIFGTPRLEEVYNRLQDLEKVAGGSGEMFWRGAFPGMVFKAEDDAMFGDDSQTKIALEDEIKSYIHGLKRYMKVKGLNVDQLEVSLADPTNHKEVLLELISGAKGIPKRILVGSERGELASSQDEANWHTRITERREDHISPNILRPFIDRLILFGVLPKPKDRYSINWPDLFTPSATEKADVSVKLMDALTKYSSMPDAQLILPQEEFYKMVFEWDDNKIESVIGMLESVVSEDDNQSAIDELTAENETLKAEIAKLRGGV